MNAGGQPLSRFYNIMLVVDPSYLDAFSGDTMLARMTAKSTADSAILALNDPTRPLNAFFKLTCKRIFFSPVLAPPFTGGDISNWVQDVNTFYRNSHPCIPFDCILIFSNSFGSGFDFGSPLSRVGIISGTFGNPRHVVAHEIGHTLGLQHTNPVCCGENVFMCTPAGTNIRFSTCEPVSYVNNNVFTPQNCSLWADEVTPFPDDHVCPPVTAVQMIVDTDNPHPVRNCRAGGDTLLFSTTLINNNQTADRNIRVLINSAESEFAEFIVDPSSPFNCIKTISGGSMEFRIVDSVTTNCDDNTEVLDSFAPFEAKTYKFKVHYKGGITPDFLGGISSFRVRVYTGNLTSPVAAKNYDIYPFVEINGGNLATLAANDQWDIDNPLYIKGDVTMNNANLPGVGNNTYDFNRNKSLLFAAGKGLTIANAKTTMVGVDVRGCEHMWKGITVNPGSEFFADMSVIEDAQRALAIQKGSTVAVQNSFLRNNNFGVFTDTIGSGGYNFTFRSNELGATADGLKLPYTGQIPAPAGKGYTGLYLENAGTVDISTLIDLPNRFLNLKHGIIAKNTQLVVRNTTFSNIAKAPAGSGYETYTNSLIAGKAIYAFGGSVDVQGGLISANPPVVFTNCHTGIEALAAGVNIWECTMSGVSNGIVAKAGLAKPYVIAWNDISASERGISVFYQSGLAGQSSIANNTVRMAGNAAGVGIAAGGHEMFPQYGGALLDNIVTMDEGASGISIGAAQNLNVTGNFVHLAGAGVLYGLKLEGGDRNTLNCNTVTNPGNGDNDGLYAMHASRARVVCNAADGTARGLHFEGMLGGKMKADVAGNTMKNNGVAGLLLGTDAVIGWQSNRGNKWENAEAFAGVNAQNDSKFIVDADENAEFLPGDWFPTDWFENVPDPTLSYLCLPGSSCPVPPEAPDEALDIKIAKGELSGIEYQAANIWLAQRRFYERIVEEGNPYPGNPDVVAFISQAQSNGLSNYAAIQTGIRQLGAMSENDRVAAATNLLALNASLTGSAAYQTNEKAVNEVLLQTVAIGNISFTQSQQDALEAIAAACPLSDGEAVLRARAMLHLGPDTPEHYDDIAICNGGERSFHKPKNSDESKQASVRVYPNPAHEEVTIQYRGLGDSDNRFVIFNTLGQMIRDIILSPDQEQIWVSLNSLPEGVCWYSVIGRGGISGKLIISR